MEARLVEILLVEDNPGDIELTREALGDCKVRNNIHSVMDGESALDFLYHRGAHATSVRPDVVLLDINLPGRDGKEILAVIKSDPVLQQIPVVMLTSSEAEKDVLKSYELHANCYVTKPVTLDAFMQLVKSLEEFWLGVVKLPPA
jgi:chemotaxis family two-component system response regulator Rcp1